MDDEPFGCLVIMWVVAVALFVCLIVLAPGPSDAEIKCEADNGVWLPQSEECYFGKDETK